ncbi:MAG: sensor histidine kinase, partial [Steroidobacteraceae bacterium]|nr:sensor histidine kinase [Steroidobacteraceae bacterium]
STTPVAIRIVARRHGVRFEVTGRNVGTITASVGAGIGLPNCRERLALLYGADATLDLAQDGYDVIARISLPSARLP